MQRAHALHSIMDIDEYIWAAFSPLHLVTVLHNVNELSVTVKTFRGFGAAELVKFGAALVAIALATVFLIVPQRDSLNAVANALCGT